MSGSGAGAGAAGLAFGFSGYLLPWNKLAFFATKVGTDIAGVIPVIGKPLMIFLRGGDDVTGATLTRFFGFHVAVLPGLFTVLLSIHLLLVQRQGMSEPIDAGSHEGEKPKTMPFFPNFAMRDLLTFFSFGFISADVINSILGIVPPQGNPYSLLDGRFSVPIPARSPGNPLTPYHVKVSIENATVDSQIIVAGTPRRRTPF